MSTSPNGGSVFFLGSRSFRSWHTIGVVSTRIAVSVVAFSLVAVGLARQSPLSGYVLVIPFLVGAVAVAFAVSLLAAFAVAQVDQVIISNRGVKCGDQFWEWQCLQAFRARRTGKSGAIRLLIWIDEDKGPGRFLPMDERITPQRALGLIHRVGEFCSANKLNVTCEASC